MQSNVGIAASVDIVPLRICWMYGIPVCLSSITRKTWRWRWRQAGPLNLEGCPPWKSSGSSDHFRTPFTYLFFSRRKYVNGVTIVSKSVDILLKSDKINAIGYNYGAGQFGRVKETIRLSHGYLFYWAFRWSHTVGGSIPCVSGVHGNFIQWWLIKKNRQDPGQL